MLRLKRRVAKESKDLHDQLHAMDYLVYADLQLGQDEKAKAVIDEMMTLTGFTETFLPGPYALGQRFRGSNHIRRPGRVCRTKCG